MAGSLEIVGSYMQSGICYRLDRRLKDDTSQILCIQKGSSLRLRTRDGRPVNIAPLNHGFLGDRKRYGCGEILAIPAYTDYQRSCKELELERYSLSVPGSIRDVQK